MTDTIDGLTAIIKRMESLSDRGKVSVMRSAIRTGLNAIGKQIRRDLDPKAKDAAKSVRSRFKAGRRKIIAKVGFGVGPRNKKRTDLTPRAAGRPGVGIGPNNVHWWISGTALRRNRYGSTGAMPAMQPGLARLAAVKAEVSMSSKMAKAAARQLEKEVAKLQRIK